MRQERSDRKSKANPTTLIEALEGRRLMSAGAADGSTPMSTRPISEGIDQSAITISLGSESKGGSPNFGGAASIAAKRSGGRGGLFSDALISRPAINNVLVATIAEGNPAPSVAVVRSNAASEGARTLGMSSAHSFAGRPPRREQNRSVSNSRGRVLLVEDDAGTSRALSAILHKQGWEVSTAATVADGIRLLATRPDHVIVDLMLPDGDGAQILEHANASSLHPHVTITTGVADSQHLERVRQLGAEAVFIKPVNLPALLRQLSN